MDNDILKTTVYKDLLDEHTENFVWSVLSMEKSMKLSHLGMYLSILRKLKKHKWRHQRSFDLHSAKTMEALHVSKNTYQAMRHKLIELDLIRFVHMSKNQNDATSVSIITKRLLEYLESRHHKNSDGTNIQV